MTPRFDSSVRSVWPGQIRITGADGGLSTATPNSSRSDRDSSTGETANSQSKPWRSRWRTTWLCVSLGSVLMVTEITASPTSSCRAASCRCWLVQVGHQTAKVSSRIGLSANWASVNVSPVRMSVSSTPSHGTTGSGADSSASWSAA